MPLVRIEPAPLDPKQEAQLTARLRSAERAASEAQAFVRRARLQTVTAGEISDTEVEIKGGLQEGETIIVHLSDQIRDGVKIAPRKV